MIMCVKFRVYAVGFYQDPSMSAMNEVVFGCRDSSLTHVLGRQRRSARAICD